MIDLISNDYPVVNSVDQLGRLESTLPSLPIATLREKLYADGYLWLRGFFTRAEVLAMRRRFFERMQTTGILAENVNPELGIFSGKKTATQQSNQFLMEFIRTAAYESFCLQPRLWGFYEQLLGDDVFLHKRKIVRHKIPLDPRCTDAHYDLIYLRGGADSVLSSWIPLGDIPLEMGGLVYLEKSDPIGRQLEDEYIAKSIDLSPQERISAYNKYSSSTGGIEQNLSVLVERYNSRWLVADYEAGDMVIHTGYMIHAATQNNSPENFMRLSTDIRYQRIHEQIDQRWQNDWNLDDGL